jgi:formylglycine-generating enzyme
MGYTLSMKKGRNPIRGGLLTSARAIFVATVLSSCALGDWGADLETFVETGLSAIYVESVSYTQNGGAVNADVVPGTPVTVTLTIANPKALPISYALECAASWLDAGSIAPSIAATEAADSGVTTATFTFTPGAGAEHGNIPFSLSMSSPGIGRSYDRQSFTVRCDSSPNPLDSASLAGGTHDGGAPFIGFRPSSDYIDSDVTMARVTYTYIATGASAAATLTIADLPTVSVPALFTVGAADASARYFIPADVTKNVTYSFTVSLIDGSGKESAGFTITVDGTDRYLQYDSNAGTGTVVAQNGEPATTMTVSPVTPLARTGYQCTGWDTVANKPGTDEPDYTPGDTLAMPDGDIRLYAHWVHLGGAGIGTGDPAVLGLSIQRNGKPVSAVTMDVHGTLKLSYAASLTGAVWSWYLDGTAIAGAAAATYSWTPSAAGKRILTARAVHEGISYSNSVSVNVCDDYMIAVVPYGESAVYHMQADSADADELCDAGLDYYNTLSPYAIGRYEVSYATWYTVCVWALANGYTFADAGFPSAGASFAGASNLASYGGYPVGSITWRDAIVWCNAYSEMTGLSPCYRYGGAVLRDATSANCDSAAFSFAGDGYRLPTETEWQYAASGCGEIPFDRVSGDSSGAQYDLYARYAANSGLPGKTGLLLPNALGVYDMSGNSKEFCFDGSDSYPTGSTEAAPASNYFVQTGTSRAVRGGSYGSALTAVKTGYRETVAPDSGIDLSSGFRLARSITK